MVSWIARVSRIFRDFPRAGCQAGQKAAALILAAASFCSCDFLGGGGSSQSGLPVISGGSGQTSSQGCFVNRYDPPEYGWGVVRCYDQYEEQQFQSQVKSYLSAICSQADLNRIQHVGCQKGGKSRMSFRGKVYFQNGQKFSLSHPAQDLKIVQKSYIEALVIPEPFGSLHMPVLRLPVRAGFVRGRDDISIAFAGRAGKMELILRNGRIDENGRFTGDMEFKNNYSMLGAQTPVTGRLGNSFAIQVCDFFDCH